MPQPYPPPNLRPFPLGNFDHLDASGDILILIDAPIPGGRVEILCNYSILSTSSPTFERDFERRNRDDEAFRLRTPQNPVEVEMTGDAPWWGKVLLLRFMHRQDYPEDMGDPAPGHMKEVSLAYRDYGLKPEARRKFDEWNHKMLVKWLPEETETEVDSG